MRWRPTEWQTKVLRRSEYEVLAGGARMAGKSECGFAFLSEPSYFYHPHYTALILRKNADDLSNWIFRARRFWGDAVEVIGKPTKLRFPGGGEALLGHLKDMGSYEKYHGHEYSKVIIEELTQVPDEDLYLKLRTVCRVKKSYADVLRPQLFLTANPLGPGHQWVRNRFVNTAYNKTYYDDRDNTTRIFIPGTVKDNPHAGQDYVDSLKGLPEHYRKAWLEGSWDIVAGQVFKELSRELQLFDHDVSPQLPIYLAGDRGRSRPYSIGFYRMDHDGRLWRFDELYGRGHRNNEGTFEDPSDIARKVCERLDHWKVPKRGNEYKYEAFYVGPDWKDKTGGKAWADHFFEKGLGLKIVPTPTGSRINAQMSIHERLKCGDVGDSIEKRRDSGYPGLYVHKRCVDWWRTVPGLCYDENDSEDLFKGQEDHAFDETGLICRSHQWTPIPGKPMPTGQELQVKRFWDLVRKARRGKEERRMVAI